MKYLLIPLTLLIFMIGCSEQPKTEKAIRNEKAITKTEKMEITEHPEPFCDTMETIIDSTSFGKRGRTKLELRLIFTDTNSFLNLRLLMKNGTKWNVKDEISAPCFAPVLSTVFSDMNGDGYNDLLFQSELAARGANVIQTLVLFDAKRNKLKRILGNFPNMEYNPKLKCINAWGFHAGSITYFLKMRNDSLTTFAEVEHADKRITSYSVNGKGKLTELKEIPEGRYRGQNCFKNYDPIEW